MEIQHRINQQRIKHIVDSYLLAGSETEAFEAYLSKLLGQYPNGPIELALVGTLVKNWLTIPMKKGIPFLDEARQQLEHWQLFGQLPCIPLTPSQFAQITGLDARVAFSALDRPTALPAATE